MRNCRQLTDKNISDLAAVYTAHELANALSIVALAREYGCGYDEVDAALRLRKYRIQSDVRYRENHKDEIRPKKYRENESQARPKRIEKETEKSKETGAAST